MIMMMMMMMMIMAMMMVMMVMMMMMMMIMMMMMVVQAAMAALGSALLSSLGLTQAERAFRPWWDAIEDHIVYTIIILVRGPFHSFQTNGGLKPVFRESWWLRQAL